MMQPWEDFIKDQKSARIGVLGLAFDQNSSYLRGAAEAPALIRKAFYSDSSNQWTENGTDLGVANIFVDAGDLTTAPGQDLFPEIEKAVTRLLGYGLDVIVLGGDHSLTYPVVRAVARKYPLLNLLHFDAHPDLYDQFDGNRYSHASPFARIMEEGLVKRLVQIGIRTINRHQRQQAQRFGVEVIEMKDWSDDLTLEFDGPLYISFDIDCLDPAFAPGVSHWEPGGFSTRQVLRVIQSLHAPIMGADIVEFNPRVEEGMTGMVAAKVFKEIVAKMLSTPPKI